MSLIQQELVSRKFVSSIQSLSSSLHTAGSLAATSVASTDGTSESGRVTTKMCLKLYGYSCARNVWDSEHRRTNEHVIQSKIDRGDICGEMPRKDVPSSPAGNRILC